MAKVTLLEYTGYGRADQEWHAANLLVFTKRTRLTMDVDGLYRIQELNREEILEQLQYMVGTISSSWEFVDITFLIQGVSRACAQQITRTRTASYAMQSQRVVDVSSAKVVNPFEPMSDLGQHFIAITDAAIEGYSDLMEDFAEPQDARGVLPMNVECNLVAKYNLRSLVELLKARRSLRTQGEYADIADQMFKAVIKVWPWSEMFFADKHRLAIEALEKIAKEIGIETGSGYGWEIAKAIDLLRKG